MLKKIARSLIIGIIAVVLATIGIDAADNYDNMSDSIIGRMLGGESGPCPSDMVFVPTEDGGFCLDRYEASPGSDCPNSSPTSQFETRENVELKSCKPVSEPGKTPWRYISQSQAAVACAKAGKRLPSEEEWYLASLGTPDPRDNWTENDCQVDGNWNSRPGETGSGLNCLSSYGAYDMVGNVWEWVKGEVIDGQYMGRDLPDSGYIVSADSNGVPAATRTNNPDPNYNNDYLWIKNSGLKAMARGGYWNSQDEAGIYSIYLVADPSYTGTGIGFRCAK